MEKQGEIILYQPDEAVRLEVRLEDETVWLTQAQIAELFQHDRTVITKHINNVFKEKELEEKSNVHFLHIANSDKPVKFFSLDVIISVGYRVKSVRGTQFRQWANKILKEYLLKGYSINQRLNDMEYRMNNRFFQIEKTIAEHDAKIDFFVRTSLPPVEGIFFDGQIFDAYKFATDLIKSAKCSLVLIDNYVDESDVMMPEMGGDELCASVKSDIETSHIPVMLLTALGDEKDMLEGLENGADAYITKPFSINVLRANIRNILANRALLRRAYAGLEDGVGQVPPDCHNTRDWKFMASVRECVMKNIDNPGFCVDMLCGMQNMSRTGFFNKLKALTGHAPADYIRSMRLQYAAQLLREKDCSITEISDDSGFSDVRYFREVFRKYYGMSPSEYRNSMRG